MTQQIDNQLMIDLVTGTQDGILPWVYKRSGSPSRHSSDSTTANGLTRCIIDFIKLHGGQAECISATGIPTKKRDVYGNTIWRTTHMTVGTADISATINGRSVKIEVKIGRDRQSDAQCRYQADVERAGGLYYLARDFEGFVSWYNLMFGKEGV